MIRALALQLLEPSIGNKRGAGAWQKAGTGRDAVAFSLGDKFTAANGRPSGFDYMRLMLALLVLASHTIETTYGDTAELRYFWHTPLRPLVGLILPMFFALSGFLVAGSMLRTKTIVEFLGLRAVRIYPALAVEVLLSALILGPLLTTLPLSAYVADSRFWLYFLNAVGDPHYFLPGVFETNPDAGFVNVQLWTVPVELACYILLAAIMFIGVRRYRWIAPAALVTLMIAYFVRYYFHHGHSLPDPIGRPNLPILPLCFIAGVAIYLYREKLPWNYTSLAVSGALSVMLMQVPQGQFLVAPAAAYFTTALGLLNPPRNMFVRGADYSYGVYLYHFSIQQTVIYLLPWAREWWINLLISLPVTVAFAAFSWLAIEKPAQKLRYVLPKRLTLPTLLARKPA